MCTNIENNTKQTNTCGKRRNKKVHHSQSLTSDCITALYIHKSCLTPQLRMVHTNAKFMHTQEFQRAKDTNNVPEILATDCYIPSSSTSSMYLLYRLRLTHRSLNSVHTACKVQSPSTGQFLSESDHVANRLHIRQSCQLSCKAHASEFLS